MPRSVLGNKTNETSREDVAEFHRDNASIICGAEQENMQGHHTINLYEREPASREGRSVCDDEILRELARASGRDEGVLVRLGSDPNGSASLLCLRTLSHINI